MNHGNSMTAIVSGKRIAWVVLAASLGLVTAGCKSQPPAPARVAVVKGTAAASTGPMCGGTDVHTKHVDLQVGCITCHPCGGAFGFDSPYTYPRGTTTAGGTLTVGVAPVVTTCTVACHSPIGAPPKSVAWNAGPRDCLDCHVKSTLPATHPAIANPTPTGADCLACHDVSSHTSGTVKVVAGACGSCHGLPPATPPSAAHPVYVFAAAPCFGCHPSSTSVGPAGDNTILAGGSHQNGTVEYTFAGHPPGWAGVGAGLAHSQQACMGCGAGTGGIDMNQYYACTECHGAAGDFTRTGGSSGVSCANCHTRQFFNPDGTTSCSFCH